MSPTRRPDSRLSRYLSAESPLLSLGKSLLQACALATVGQASGPKLVLEAYRVLSREASLLPCHGRPAETIRIEARIVLRCFETALGIQREDREAAANLRAASEKSQSGRRR